MKFNQRVGPKKPKPVSVVSGRSASAPPTAILTSSNAAIKIVDITDVEWTGVTTKVRLAYDLLDGVTSGVKGVVIDYPDIGLYEGTYTSNSLRDHFRKIATEMEAPKTHTTVTEATGEAAAAIGVLAQFGTKYELLWGFHCHSGPGIDQIWGVKNKSGSDPTYSEYLVVEAKGPGASLNSNVFLPPGIGTQMSKEWIVDNLKRMADNHSLGKTIRKDLGLTFTTTYPNYMGATKSYYGLDPSKPPSGTATLHGMVITADWKVNGDFGYTHTTPDKHF